MDFPLSPGFLYSLTDIQIVDCLLKRKVLDPTFCNMIIGDFDDLPCKDPCTLPGRDTKRYFFGKRLRNVITVSRYWTPIGQEKRILDPESKEVVGIRKTLALVHSDGKMPFFHNQPRSLWFMYEYRLAEMHGTDQQEWAVYCVFLKETKTYHDIHLWIESETDESEESGGEEKDDGDQIGQAGNSSGIGPPPAT
ncbi:PREDICTED: NAC domain-containing protein 83-like [Tarenaya hassleriana]|uniref:NAC domain-containing protein 83-like n=1 Tax=Tarenaya hassleriana TaxID=28532 RepID=UPI00053C4EAF|nr:PREDICTED: NAC domain-containing protein 83-like [Tarenaya hassleriana]